MKKFQALGGALVFAMTGAFIVAPAYAFTHHPSTAKERAQTRDLNLQQLSIAQGQAPANQQAMNANPQPAQPAQAEQSAPSDQSKAAPSTSAPAPNAPSNGAQAPMAPSDQSTPKAQQPAPSGSQ